MTSALKRNSCSPLTHQLASYLGWGMLNTHYKYDCLPLEHLQWDGVVDN